VTADPERLANEIAAVYPDFLMLPVEEGSEIIVDGVAVTLVMPAVLFVSPARKRRVK
jgi:hypothetical protein